MVPLGRGEVHPREHSPGLGGIVVRDGGLEMLPERGRLAELPAQPAKEAYARLVAHDAGGYRPAPRGRTGSDNGDMKEILPELERWRQNGEAVAVATVVATRRSAPRPVGSSLGVSASGKLCGSVSGGCVESDVYEQAQEVLATGEPRLVSYGISDEQAWSVGLPCGGEIDEFVERLL